jgi:NADH-quinone oxidoreductase subunit I
MAENEKNIQTTQRIGDQPIGSEYAQDLLAFLDREFAKPEHAVKRFLGRFLPLFGCIKGLNATRAALMSPKYTVKYPEEKLQMSDAFRGRHVLLTSLNDDQLCICCNACATICPIGCIEIKSEKSPEDSRRKRDLVEYNVNLTTCLFCGLCQEACPEFCIILSKTYEYSEAQRGPGGLLRVRMEDITRRATDEEWAEIQKRKASKKKPE